MKRILVLPFALMFCSELGAQTLADKPVFDTQQVKPNIMFTIDNSGSMRNPFVPDGLNSGRNCFRNYAANGLYFNPSLVYEAPKKADGTDYPNVPFNAAPIDGYDTGRGTRDFTQANQFNHTCQGESDAVNCSGDFPNYMQHNTSTPPSDCTNAGASANANYTKIDVRTLSATVKQNFANWFAYYRTRMLATKTAAGQAFYPQIDQIRVGYHRLAGQTNDNFLPMGLFGGTQRDKWYQQLYASAGNFGTPSRAAAIRVGEYFLNREMRFCTGGAGQDCSTSNFSTSTFADPIEYSCQVNSHLFATDGYWNESLTGQSPAAGDQDQAVPALPVAVPGLTTGSAWPNILQQSSATVVTGQINSGTLADVAMKYWVTDLRTSGANAANNVPASSDGDRATNPAKDPATWQHLNFYGISIDARGSKTYLNTQKSNDIVNQPFLASVVAGTDSWPHPYNNNQTGIDDLWHATISSRGLYFNVNSPQALRDALAEALADVTSKVSTAARAGVDNPNLGVSSDDVAYVPSYRSGVWSGDITAKSIDPTTGLTLSDLWNASARVATQNWDTGRRIFTRSDAANAAVAFRFSQLSTAQQNSLDIKTDATTARRQAVLEYLRGSRAEELGGSGTYKFRKRIADFGLGDIVNAEPVLVGAPNEEYSNTKNPGYDAYKTAQTARRPVVYANANDGMIHAIDGRTNPATAGGKELWAYVPSALFRSDATGLGSLVWKAFDPPPYTFKHQYYIDASGVARDVDFTRTSPSTTMLRPNGLPSVAPDWRTVYVTGLGKGGKSVVALDVTAVPGDADTEASIVTSNKLLWELADSDLGYVYGKPYVGRTERFGWVAFVPAGYSNTTGPNAGKGVILVVDVKSGAILHRFVTSVGSSSDPSGLAHVEGFIPDKTDFLVTELYAGDLKGNIWRFDVRGTGPLSASGTRLATLKDGSGKDQPITSVVRPALDPKSGKRYVFVGTGRLLATDDLTCAGGQTTGCVTAASRVDNSLYAIKDGDQYSVPVVTAPLVRADLVSIAKTSVSANTAAAADTSKGWYIDLSPDERAISEPVPNFGNIVWVTQTPSTDLCSPGAFGTAYARTFLDAESKIKVAGVNSAFFGGTGSENIVGARFLKTSRSSGGKIVGTITDSRGNVAKLDIGFPPSFIGIGVNYREILN